jgi:hypothetical protein
MAGIALIVVAVLAIWWVEQRPDLDLGIGILVFGLSWTAGLVGIYMTLRTFWI